MAKIRMCNVLWFVLEYTVLFVMGKTEPVNVIFCEDSRDGYEQVSCPENKTIGWKSIKYVESPCQDANNRNICLSNINTYFDDHCLGQNNCTLPFNILFKKNCQRPSRRLEVHFECSGGFWSSNKHPAPVDTCANSLKEVYCPSGYHIHIEGAKSSIKTSGCDSMNVKQAKAFLKRLCNENRRCSSDTSKTSLLYHKRFASIQYVCKGPTDRPVTESIHSTSTDRKLETTTFAAENISSSENDELPELSLDKDHRVVIYFHSKNQTQHLCSSEWDDDDASVLCTHLNSTWIGNSTVVDTLLDIPVADYSLHCDGLEASLFECNFTKYETSCNTTKVAGAMCCQGTKRLGKCVTYPSPQKESSRTSGSSTLGIAVGIPVAIIVVVCVIVVIAFVWRRYVSKDSDRKFLNFMSKTTDDDYIGQQNIALPQYPSNKKVLNSQGTNSSTNTTKNKDGQDYSHPSKDTQSPYVLSEEGVYDKTNEQRHVVNNSNVYSHAVDTMYDSAKQNTRQDGKEETYDHVFGQKTEDYYDKTTRS
ncbi:uncharacterized protein LOC127709444 [Mytilus californianus]|uniref:uncharacterized protein LOC127709444 n=1 Tax=Mytilus californianus TaxID=6549 RepID=UPI0022464A31|nr:uncharacterized protein LOC127709444 [Mytilus californianus]